MRQVRVKNYLLTKKVNGNGACFWEVTFLDSEEKPMHTHMSWISKNKVYENEHLVTTTTTLLGPYSKRTAKKLVNEFLSGKVRERQAKEEDIKTVGTFLENAP